MKAITEKNLLILRNLKDAGCNNDTIKKYFQLQKEGKEQEQFRLLAIHKASLLEQLHVSQYMIDCLDYLVYEMRNKNL